MATRKRKMLRTEADRVASIDEELANDSNSDVDCVPEISNSEDSDDENDISDSGPGPSVDGFCKKDPSTRYSTLHRKSSSTICCSKWNRYDGIITSLQNSFKLLSTRQIYTHNNRSRPVTKRVRSQQWKPVTIL
jgi:hypothetical protein